MFLMIAYQSYGEAQKKAQMWHDDHLNSLHEAPHAKQNNSTPAGKHPRCARAATS
jgi:hypothetical protein